jgi:DNA (cytosine-5)-methyltransferase 1
MRLGGLFSGVGGFELAWTQLGHEVAWMCEIDKSARKVLEARFPGVPIYEDVEQLDPAEVEAVDVLTGGSPCQGFSVAGSRSGLEHGESRLFADYIRIMEGLAARGLKWALWENVPGVLSIQNDDGEHTYEHVVAALVGATEPVRLGQGRWNTGLADGGGRAVAWRVLDSRYFGVAQRRRRVFACVAFGGVAADRAGRALLAVAEGLPRDSQACGSEGEGAAGGVAGRVGVPSVAGTLGAKGSGGVDDLDRMTFLPDAPSGYRMTAFGQYEDDDSASTLKQRDHKDATDLVADSPAVLMTMREGKPGGGKGPLLVKEESLTLATGNGQTLFQPQAFDEMNFTTDPDTHHVLRSGTPQSTGVLQEQTTHAIVEEMVDFGRTSDRIRLNAQTAATLQSGGGGAGANTGLYMAEYTADETGTLQARTYKGLNHENVRDGQAVVQTYGVRRLTPVECERLQAFPDGWTEPAGSDSARYKALGNAVTVNTVRWVLGRMLEQS